MSRKTLILSAVEHETVSGTLAKLKFERNIRIP